MIFSLNDNVDVQSEEIKKDWSFCGIYVYVKTSSLVRKLVENNEYYIEKIEKDQLLFDKNKKVIGKTLDSVEIWRDYEKKDNDFYECLIVGYTYKNNIRWETSIEKAFENVINNCNDVLISHSYLEPHMKEYGYWDSYAKENGFEAYEHPENNMNDESPRGRIILIFYKGNVAAILYQRPMSFKKYKVTRNMRGFKVVDLQKSLGENYEKYLGFVTTYSGE